MKHSNDYSELSKPEQKSADTFAKFREFLNLDVNEAKIFYECANWEIIFAEVNVFASIIFELAAPAKRPDRPHSGRDLVAKTCMILELPLLARKEYREACSQALSLLCQNIKFLSSDAITSIARGLLGNGANANVKSSRGESCLKLAATGTPSLVQMLLHAGANIADVDIFSCTREDTARLLIESGAPLSATESEVLWKLFCSSVSIFNVAIQWLRQRGFVLVTARWHGQSALHIAAADRDIAKLEYFIPFFPDIDVVNDFGATALMRACTSSLDEAVPRIRMLLTKGASVDATDSVGKTPLMWAIEFADREAIVDELLAHGPNLEARDSMGNTALHYCAARRENQHMTHMLVQKLVTFGADLNATNSLGQTPLMLLSMKTPKAVVVLLGSGALLTAKDMQGRDIYAYAGSETRKWLKCYASSAGSSRPENLWFPQTDLTVHRSKKIIMQIEKAQTLRKEIVTKLDKWIAAQPPSSGHGEIWQSVLTACEFASEGIGVKLEDKVANDVDRTGNMLSGPFFTSKQYPIVKNGYPVVQLDLQQVSAISGKALGDGLFQLWEQSNLGDLLIRVIPKAAVSSHLMTPFSESDLKDGDDTGVAYPSSSYPAQGSVRVFKSYFSLGLEAEDLADDLYVDPNVADSAQPSDSLLSKIVQFHKLTNRVSDHEIKLFGRNDSYYCAFDQVDKRMLLEIPYGGRSAAVFYELSDDGDVAFLAVS